MTTYAEHAAQIREAHIQTPQGWCHCGLTRPVAPAIHAAHVAAMVAEAAQRHAEKIARGVLALNLASPADAQKPDAALRHVTWTGDRVREMLTAAALQALTETENAR